MGFVLEVISPEHIKGAQQQLKGKCESGRVRGGGRMSEVNAENKLKQPLGKFANLLGLRIFQYLSQCLLYIFTYFNFVLLGRGGGGNSWDGRWEKENLRGLSDEVRWLTGDVVYILGSCSRTELSYGKVWNFRKLRMWIFQWSFFRASFS